MADTGPVGREIGNVVETFGHIPYDTAVFDGSMEGKTVFDLERSSPGLEAVRGMLEHILA